MKKPKKLNVNGEGERPAMVGEQRIWWEGYNQACSDWEEYLKSTPKEKQFCETDTTNDCSFKFLKNKKEDIYTEKDGKPINPSQKPEIPKCIAPDKVSINWKQKPELIEKLESCWIKINDWESIGKRFRDIADKVNELIDKSNEKQAK